MGRHSNYNNDMYKQLQEIMGRLDSVEKDLSSNTSAPSSSDQKGGKPANTYHGRKGTTLTKADVEKKLQNGNCQHCVKHLGTPNDQPYIVKYVIDLDVRTVKSKENKHSTMCCFTRHGDWMPENKRCGRISFIGFWIRTPYQ